MSRPDGERSDHHNYFAYITPKLDTYAWLVGNKWTIFCGTRALCSELQADVGRSINASADQPPETTTATTMAEAPLDEQVAYTAQRWILEGFGQPADGSFKNVPCTDEDPDMMRYCWASYINNFTFKDGTLYVHMDTDWTQQSDGARMVTAQNTIRNLLKNGPGPKLVMDNVQRVQSMDINGVTRSDAPLHS